MLRHRSWAIAALVSVYGFVPTHAQMLTLEPIGSYQTGVFGEGAAEIACYHAGTQRVFSVNGKDRAIDIVSLERPGPPAAHRPGATGVLRQPANIGQFARQSGAPRACWDKRPQHRGQVVFFTPDGKSWARSRSAGIRTC